MRRFILSIALVVMTLCAQAETILLADPTIYYEDGVYYLSGTLSDSGFLMYKSTDLVHWTKCGNASGGLCMNKADSFGDYYFWAPQFFKYEGSYYLAYAAEEYIAIAKADSPEGPYKQADIHALPYTSKQIDPYVFIDDDGKKYMYYVRESGGNIINVCELTDDFSSIKEGTVKECFGPTQTWEKYQAWVTEGPTMYKEGDYYYLIYSANDYQSIEYAVGYAYSKSPTGPWTKIDHPFLSRHSIGINGTGHGDLFQDADGNWYYVFHVHASNNKVQTRRTCIVPITITDDVNNKFVPQTDRFYILDDAASPSKTFPEGEKTFEQDGVRYSTYQGSSKYVQVTFKDPVNFGGYEGEYTIPSSVENDGTTYKVYGVGPGAFYNCQDLTKVTLSQGIKKIDVGAFENCGIESVSIPASVTSIGYKTFTDAESLLDVIVEKSTPANISAGTFSDNTLSAGKLWVAEGSEEKYASADNWADFKRISGVERGTVHYDFVKDGVYYDITSNADQTCKVIDQTSQYATYRGPVVDIPAEVENEGTTYKVTEIGKMAFRDSRLVEQVNIPEGIEKVGQYAFYDCRSMHSITLPSTLTSLSTFAFYGDTKFNEVTCWAMTPPEALNKNVFAVSTYDGTLYVPYGTKDAYAQAVGWKEFKEIKELEQNGISNSVAGQSVCSGTYNLAGQRVNSSSFKGLVIANGKKYILK